VDADQLVGVGDGLGPAADLDATRPPGSVLARSSMTMAAWAARATSRYFMVLFIFDGGQLDAGNGLSGAAPGEIEEVRFWADPDLADALPPRLRGRVASAPRGQGDTYLEREAATGP
jgi:hypothetical protein